MASKRGPRDKGPNGRAPSKPAFAFGSDEEVANREGRGMMAGGPDMDAGPATPFRWTSGSMGSGSINRAPLQHSGKGDRKRLGPGR
jgi:hypothetical protein